MHTQQQRASLLLTWREARICPDCHHACLHKASLNALALQCRPFFVYTRMGAYTVFRLPQFCQVAGTLPCSWLPCTCRSSRWGSSRG